MNGGDSWVGKSKSIDLHPSSLLFSNNNLQNQRYAISAFSLNNNYIRSHQTINYNFEMETKHHRFKWQSTNEKLLFFSLIFLLISPS